MLDEGREELVAQGINWEHRVPKTTVASNRFCPSCLGGVGEDFTYLAFTGTQLNLEPAFPSA